MKTEQKIHKLREQLKQQKRETARYKKGFYVLNPYFDSISDEEQPKVAKKLDKLGL